MSTDTPDWEQIRDALDELAVELRTDSISNTYSGLGDPYFDRHEATRPAGGSFTFSEDELDEQYEYGRLARRLIESGPDDCTRRGWRLVVAEDDRADPVAKAFRALNVRAKFREAHVLANLTGGGAILIAVDDNAPIEEPIQWDSVRGVKALHVFDRFECRPDRANTRPLDDGGASLDVPETYLLTPSRSAGSGAMYHNRVVHSSRIIRFEGPYVRRRRRHLYHGWGMPLIEALWRPVRDLETVSQALATTIHEFKYGVLKLQDLKYLLTGPQGEQSSARLQARLRVMLLTKSLIKALVLDAERESYETREINVSGLDQAYAIFQQNLAAVAHMPLTKLFGQAPKGFTSEDKTGQDNWDDHCESLQARWYAPGLTKLAELVLIAQERKLPEDYEIRFYPLRTPTDAEKASTYSTIAEADEKYLNMGVLTEDELHTRFERAEFSVDLMLEEDSLLPPDELDAIARETPGAVVDVVEQQEDEAPPAVVPPPDDLVSLREAGERMNVPTQTISALTRSGRLPYWQLGSHRRVSVSDVLRLAAERADANGPRWMLALVPSPEFAARVHGEATAHGVQGVDGAPYHVTLVYGGHRPDYEPIDQIGRRVADAIADVVANWRTTIHLKVSGAGVFFNAEQCAHLLVGGPGLERLRAELFTALDDAHLLPPQQHGFIPHMTLRYVPDGEDLPDNWTNVARVDYPAWEVDAVLLIVDDTIIRRFELGHPTT